MMQAQKNFSRATSSPNCVVLLYLFILLVPLQEKWTINRRVDSITGKLMGHLLNIVTPLHQQTKRDYIGRMMDDKVVCMITAKEYEFDYWDGDRRYGYGGYRYIEGRWRNAAQSLINIYGLKADAKILDVGCGKAHLLYELKRLLPDAQVFGFDISRHGLADAKEEVRNHLFRYRAQDPYPFGDKHFDLVISLGCLHNLRIFELQSALREIERVGNNK